MDNLIAPKTLAQFDAELKDAFMLGQWTYEHLLHAHADGPKSYGVPHLWAWDQVHPKILESCEMLPKSNDARRNLSFRNPATDGRPATQTISVGVQAVVPGEICWAHRHSIDALRFAIKGSPSLYTVVDGEVMPMETGDLVLTPAYSWHDHHNEGDETGIWLDVLNTGMMFSLNQIFYEEYGDEMQPRRTRKSDYIDVRGGPVRPAWEELPQSTVPYRYAWRYVERTLRRFHDADGSPYDDILLRYANPFTGGPTFHTMDAYVQQLRPGFEGEPHRQTSSAVYHVIEGEGRTIVGDHELTWKSGDTFCVPHWIMHRHINASAAHEALMFVVSDVPALAALGLYREEPRRSMGATPPPAVPAHQFRRDVAPLVIR